MPLFLYKNPFLTISYVVSFIIGFILVAVTFYIPLWVQEVSGKSATLSGLAVFPLSVTWIFGAFITNKFITKSSIAKLGLFGISTLLAGCIGLLFLQEQTAILWMMLITAI